MIWILFQKLISSERKKSLKGEELRDYFSDEVQLFPQARQAIKISCR